MKSCFLAVLAFLFSAYAANAIPMGSIVLGVNLDPSEKQFVFPCVQGPANVVFCDKFVSIGDSQCERSLSYRNIAPKVVDIYCQSKNGQTVVLARAQGELTMDSTQDAFGYVGLKMNPAVTLKSVTHGGATRYVLELNGSASYR